MRSSPTPTGRDLMRYAHHLRKRCEDPANRHGVVHERTVTGGLSRSQLNHWSGRGQNEYNGLLANNLTLEIGSNYSDLCVMRRYSLVSWSSTFSDFAGRLVNAHLKARMFCLLSRKHQPLRLPVALGEILREATEGAMPPCSTTSGAMRKIERLQRLLKVEQLAA